MAPVWEEPLNQYLVDISYPDQTRKRKRFSSLKKASAFGAHEMTAIEEGTWKNTFVPRTSRWDMHSISIASTQA
jgi:hypothetical protein